MSILRSGTWLVAALGALCAVTLLVGAAQAADVLKAAPPDGAHACPMHGNSHGGPQSMPLRPALGISISDEDSGDEGSRGAVKGVTVAGVMPGGGAADAGLQVGDVLTAINDEPLAAASRAQANRELVRQMQSVNAGEEVSLNYLRDGRAGTVKVEARPLPPPMMGGMGGHHHPRRQTDAGTFAGIRLAELTPDLGRYFAASGSAEGVLVLRAPANAAVPLKDGDVIQDIDGRKPTDRRHALRILGSYARGETVELKILRDRKVQTLKFTTPAG